MILNIIQNTVNHIILHASVHDLLTSYFALIILGNISKVYPLVWRFLPALDATVETLLVRDLDSQISNREVAAVSEFLKSNKEFHVMRDHPYHGVAILGGTWGVKLSNSKGRQAFAKSFARMAKDPQSKAPRTKAGPDQVLLKRHVW